MPTPEQNAETVRTFVDEVFNRRNLEFAEKSLTDDFVEHNPLTPEMGNDKAGAMATFQALAAAMPDTTAVTNFWPYSSARWLSPSEALSRSVIHFLIERSHLPPVRVSASSECGVAMM